jgi:hypothetical protein
VSEALAQLKGIIGSGFPGLAEYILARHAHELAEKIRSHDYDPGEVAPVHLAFVTAADLIDPEVT